MRHLLRPAAFAVAISCSAFAQDASTNLELASALPSRLEQVLVDEPGDGNLWVLAPGYKARFGKDGVDFVPYYGPRAPRNHPVSFRLASARRGSDELRFVTEVAPQRLGDRVVFERGALREIWVLREQEVEQTFELQAADGRGELRFRIAVTSDGPCHDVVEGLHFAHAGFGGVLYGDVRTIDSAGKQHASSSRWSAGHIELSVPASFADRAEGTLLVDPTVRTLTIDNGTDDTYAPDVAFEPTNRTWLVVYERRFSATDTDILARRYDAAGTFLDIATVAGGSRESHRPAVGANALDQQFLIAWDEDTGISDREILARTRASGGTTQGTTNVMPSASAATHEDIAPRVGGSNSTDALGDRFVIVNEVVNTFGTRQRYNITRVSGAGIGVGTTLGGVPGEQATELAVSRSRSTNGGWLASYVAGGLLRAESLVALNSVGTTLTVDGTLLELGSPSVCGIGDDFVIAYDRITPLGDHNVRLVEVSLVNGIPRLGRAFDATAVEPGAAVRNDQHHAAISSDGCRYTYAYLENATGSSDVNVFAAVVSIGSTLAFSDGHRALHTATPSELEGPPRIASTGEIGGDLGIHLVVYDRELGANDHDVRGNLFHGTANSAGTTIVPSACGGGLAPVISVQNPPALGATVRIRATVFDPLAQFFLLGLETPPVPLCPANCRLGVFPILATIQGTALDVPIACDLGLVGARVALQNLWLGGASGCGAPQFALPFNLSDTVVIEVQ